LLEDGDFIVIDAGPDYGYYDVDITISYPANGHFTPRQREVYQAAYEVQKICMSLYKPGVTREEVKEKVKTILKEKGYDLSKDVFKKRTIIETGGFTHFVGMAVHDVGGGPANWGILKPGMVFACDIYAAFPGQKLGVRIEDTVLITEDGCQNLTRGIPRSIDEIEKLMKEKGLVRTLKEKGLY
jgi:Xaa-Pro aminopeptidase